MKNREIFIETNLYYVDAIYAILAQGQYCVCADNWNGTLHGKCLSSCSGDSSVSCGGIENNMDVFQLLFGKKILVYSIRAFKN